MIPTSDALAKWLSHISGKVKLRPKPGMRRLEEAIELNTEAAKIRSTFGDQEFQAITGFMDMRGFSSRSKGRSPRGVRDIAAPFVATVVEIACKHESFIDKTIGDEVMIIMPSFGEDVALSDIGLKETTEPFLFRLSDLLADLMELLSVRVPGAVFTGGFAIGRIILDEVGATNYRELTAYGNSVNAAKRLQALAGEHKTDSASTGWHRLAVGALKDEEPGYEQELNSWLEVSSHIGRLQLISASVSTTECKGVGPVSYLSADLGLKME